MAEHPVNLSDGELWLPDDIFLGEVRSEQHSSRRIENPSGDELVQYLSALSLFRSHPQSQSPPNANFQRFRPPVRCGSVEPFMDSELYRANNGVFRNRDAPPRTSSKQSYRLQLQVERFLEARARLLQRQQNRVQSRLMPVQGRSGTGLGGSGGTGVFLPRVSATTNTGFGKKQRVKNRREIQADQSQRHSMVLEEHCCQFPPSPEVVLPQDWTY